MNESLISKINSYGFEIDTLKLDGQVHRFKTSNKPKKKNGWYVGKVITLRGGRTLEICTVGDWALGETKTFTSNDEMSDSDRKMFSAASKKMQAEMDALQLAERAKAAKEASLLWADGIAVEKGFEYLQKKHIETLRPIDLIRMTKDKSAIIIPVFNKTGDIRSCQTIDRDGQKRFLTGGEIRSNFFPIKGQGELCIVCEGFATGVSLYAALSGQVSVIVAFNASNLFPVCAQMVSEFGRERVFIAADDDRYNGHNAGLTYAEKCKELGVKVIVPNFEAIGYDSKPTDFNDLHCEIGLFELEAQIQESGFFGQNTSKTHETSDETSQPKAECLWPSKEIGFFIEIPMKNGQIKHEPQFMELSYYFRDALKLRASDSFCLIWRETHYETVERNEIFNLIVDLTMSKAKPWQLEHFYKMIKAVCNATSLKPLLEIEGKINLKNGILDVRTKNISPHSSEFDFKYCLPYEYDPKAACPKWNKYLSEVFENDLELIDLAAESFGYTVLGGDPFLHIAFMLYGDGRNGKSVFIFMLEQLLGPKNYANKSIESLSEKFSRASLLGKIANLAGETSKREIDSGSFKQIVGGDNIDASFKGKDEFEFKPMCRIFFSCNEFPTFKDATRGMTSKLIILPFKRIFDEAEQIKGLKYQIAKDELSGIFNWAMIGLDRVMVNQRLTSPASVRNIKDEYRKESCSVFDFLTTKCDETKTTIPTEIKEFYHAYKTYCELTDRSSRGLNQFSKKMVSYLTDRNGSGAVTRSNGNYAQTNFLSLKSTVSADKKESKNGSQNTSSSGQKLKNFADDISPKQNDATQANSTHRYKNTLM